MHIRINTRYIQAEPKWQDANHVSSQLGKLTSTLSTRLTKQFTSARPWFLSLDIITCVQI